MSFGRGSSGAAGLKIFSLECRSDHISIDHYQLLYALFQWSEGHNASIFLHNSVVRPRA